MTHSSVTELLDRCPFLRPHIDADFIDLPTVVFGAAGRTLADRVLAPEEEDTVFAFFNDLADRGRADDLEILGTGAIELFNDDAAIQQLARAKLRGRALAMLEQFRQSWGQPDYGRRFG